jgi:hypothetical protein
MAPVGVARSPDGAGPALSVGPGGRAAVGCAPIDGADRCHGPTARAACRAAPATLTVSGPEGVRAPAAEDACAARASCQAPGVRPECAARPARAGATGEAARGADRRAGHAGTDARALGSPAAPAARARVRTPGAARAGRRQAGRERPMREARSRARGANVPANALARHPVSSHVPRRPPSTPARPPPTRLRPPRRPARRAGRGWGSWTRASLNAGGAGRRSLLSDRTGGTVPHASRRSDDQVPLSPRPVEAPGDVRILCR